jgi:hypothetical protein
MQADFSRELLVEATQKLQELLVAMPLIALPDHPSLQDLQSRERAGGSMAKPWCWIGGLWISRHFTSIHADSKRLFDVGCGSGAFTIGLGCWVTRRWASGGSLDDLLCVALLAS